MNSLTSKNFTLTMVLRISIFYLLFKVLSWCEISTPVWVFINRVWIKIIGFNGPAYILLLKCINKCLGCWHNKLHIVCILLIAQINHKLQLFEALLCVLESEIISHLNKYVFCRFVCFLNGYYVVNHLVSTEVPIVVG